jgi:hypothetical protein
MLYIIFTLLVILNAVFLGVGCYSKHFTTQVYFAGLALYTVYLMTMIMKVFF